MTASFCLHCGIKTEGNTGVSATSGDRLLLCPCCGLHVRFYIQAQPSKTDEEVEAAFQNTPLTDSQRGTKRHTSPKAK
jgi:transcription elongation factor Elf1